MISFRFFSSETGGCRGAVDSEAEKEEKEEEEEELEELEHEEEEAGTEARGTPSSN